MRTGVSPTARLRAEHLRIACLSAIEASNEYLSKKASELLEFRKSHVSRGVATAHPIFVDRAQGSYVWDTEGNEYLDFVGGIGVLNTGHNHPKVVEAVQRQLQRVTHAAFQVAA